MALTILNIGDLKGWDGQLHASANLTPGKSQVSIAEEVGWASDSV